MLPRRLEVVLHVIGLQVVCDRVFHREMMNGVVNIVVYQIASDKEGEKGLNPSLWQDGPE